MDEIIILACLLILTAIGYFIKYKKNKYHKNNSTQQNEADYAGSKILIIGETGLITLLIGIIFSELKHYIIFLWGICSFILVLVTMSGLKKYE